MLASERAIVAKYRGWSYDACDKEGLRLCQLAAEQGDWGPILPHLIALNKVMESAPRLVEADFAEIEKRSLLWIVSWGTGQELDELGRLVDLARNFLGPDNSETDVHYRARLRLHPQVQLLLNYRLGHS